MTSALKDFDTYQSKDVSMSDWLVGGEKEGNHVIFI